MPNLGAAFAQIAGAVSSAFGGPYHAAKLLYAGVAVKDEGGSIVTPASPVSVDCQVQVDSATDAMRAEEEFVEGDVRLLILGLSSIAEKSKIRMDAGPFAGQVYAVQSKGRDTMAFGWECRAREVKGDA